MSRITIELAEHIAKQMTVNKQKEIDKLVEKQRKMARDYTMSLVPKDVLKLFEEKCKYVKTDTIVRLWGHGCQNLYVYVDEYPCTTTNTITPTPKFASEIIKITDKINNLKDAKKKLVRSIEEALRQMRTFKRVQSDFPEAAEFLPTISTTMLPMINLDTIRKELSLK